MTNTPTTPRKSTYRYHIRCASGFKTTVASTDTEHNARIIVDALNTASTGIVSYELVPEELITETRTDTHGREWTLTYGSWNDKYASLKDSKHRRYTPAGIAYVGSRSVDVYRNGVTETVRFV